MNSRNSYTASPTRSRRRWRPLLSMLGVAALVVGVSSASSARTNQSERFGLPTQTIFGSAVPRIVTDPDQRSVEIGTKFQVKQDGLVTGVRFYKSDENRGHHTGSLWDSSGNRLASVSFDNESTSGWQTARFAWPVRVVSDRTYLVSYHAPEGHYSADPGYFSGKGAGEGDVQALADGADGPNGAYVYGDVGFPTTGWKSASYYVDVTFVAFRFPQSSSPAAAQPPVITTAPTTTTEASTTTTAAPDPAPPVVVTPPPTAAPKPGPAPKAQAVPAAIRGGFPSAANTGPGGTPLRPASSNTINAPGTYDGVLWTSCLNINASNVVIRNSRIKSANRCADALVRTGYDNRGIVLENVELDGQGGAGYGICCSGYTLSRVNAFGFMHGAHVNDNVTIKDSWIHDLAMKPGDHVDGIISNGDSHNLVIQHNVITNPFGQTSAIAMFDDFGCFTNVTVDSNILGGGGYSVYAGSHCNPGQSNMRWTNNRFLHTAQFGAVTDVSPSVLWTNNVWDDSSQAISGN
jgi:hypothetical protein